MPLRKPWIASDFHFTHSDLPRNIDQKDAYRKAKKSLLAIPEDHILYYIGDIDVARGEGTLIQLHEDVFQKMKCKKFLIIGNHDRQTYSWYYDHGWDFVAESITIVYKKLVIKMIHDPAMCFDSDYDLLIHGHWHGTEQPKKKSHALYSPELENYAAVTLDNFLYKYKGVAK